MSQRERDARAAMRSIIRVTCASEWHAAEGRLDYSMPTNEHIAKLANEVADAMDAERRKREAAEAPTPEHHACHAEIAAAMREGRDAGMREARGRLGAMADENTKLRAVAEAAARLQRWRHSDQVSYAEGAQSDDALMATLDAALPNWRSAP